MDKVQASPEFAGFLEELGSQNHDVDGQGNIEGDGIAS
jgi:hypothetical protein